MNLPSRSRAVAMPFKRYPWQSYPCTTSCLGRKSRGSYVNSLLIFHQIPAYSSQYTKNTNAANKHHSSCLL